MTGAAQAVEIDLWHWPLEIGAAKATRRRHLLTAPERARADRFVQDRDAVHFTAARASLREILGLYTGAAPQDVPLRAGRNRKPVLANGPVFNLSHAAGLAVLAVTRDNSVWLGIDIEGARTIEPGLETRAFAPEERAQLQGLAQTDWHAAFFRGWTRKEAVIKATGDGLYADLQGFAVTLDNPPRLTRLDTGTKADWRIHDFTPRPNLAGAIAAMTRGREIRVIPRT